MSTRAQIAIQTGPEEWAHVYVHYDGYPAHMLPALSRWTPEDILAAREIRQVHVDELDCFVPPHRPKMLPRPTRWTAASRKRFRFLNGLFGDWTKNTWPRGRQP